MLFVFGCSPTGSQLQKPIRKPIRKPIHKPTRKPPQTLSNLISQNFGFFLVCLMFIR